MREISFEEFDYLIPLDSALLHIDIDELEEAEVGRDSLDILARIPICIERRDDSTHTRTDYEARSYVELLESPNQSDMREPASCTTTEYERKSLLSHRLLC